MSELDIRHEYYADDGDFGLCPVPEFEPTRPVKPLHQRIEEILNARENDIADRNGFEDVMYHGAGYLSRDEAEAAILQAVSEAVERIIGPDSPLEPTSDAVGEVDPTKWLEWSIVENHLRAQQRQRKGKEL